jgi:putative ABC transport system permease protein
LIVPILGEGMVPALIGTAMGLVTAIGAARVMSSMLFKVKPCDAAVFAWVSCGLLVICFAASLIPALRSTTIDPAQALRAE